MRRPLLLAALAALLAAPAARAGDGAPPEGGKPPAAGDGAAKPAEPKAADPKPAEKKPAESGKAPAKAAEKTPPAAKEAPGKEPKAQVPAVLHRAPRSKEEALRILDELELSVDFDATPLAAAVDHLSTVSGMNMILGPALLQEGDLELRRVTLRLKKLSVRRILELLADGQGLGIGFRDGVLLVTTPKEARGKPVLRLYPIGDLAMPLRDFPAPDLVLHPQGYEAKTEEPKETKGAWSEPEDIQSLVKDNTGEGTWEDAEVSISTMRDWLVVRQYPEVHREIAGLLDMVRAAR